MIDDSVITGEKSGLLGVKGAGADVGVVRVPIKMPTSESPANRSPRAELPTAAAGPRSTPGPLL